MPSAQGRDVAPQVFELKRKVEQEKRHITSVCQPQGVQRPSIASGLALGVCATPRQKPPLRGGRRLIGIRDRRDPIAPGWLRPSGAAVVRLGW